MMRSNAEFSGTPAASSPEAPLERRVGGHDRYVTCMRCGYIMSWFAHTQLRVAVDCPECGPKPVASEQFGPGVYVEDFCGYTIAEAIRRRTENTPNVKVSGRERPYCEWSA